MENQSRKDGEVLRPSCLSLPTGYWHKPAAKGRAGEYNLPQQVPFCSEGWYIYGMGLLR